MGILNSLFQKTPARLARLPRGSFTVDAEGRVVASTLPQAFPEAFIRDIGRIVLAYFRGAQQAQVRIREVIVAYPALKLCAREMRGGAIVFLSPQSLTRN
jgi:hypothetical protein